MPTEDGIVPRQRTDIDKGPWSWSPVCNSLETMEKLGSNICHAVESTVKSGPILQRTSVQEKLLRLHHTDAHASLLYPMRLVPTISGLILNPSADHKTRSGPTKGSKRRLSSWACSRQRANQPGKPASVSKASMPKRAERWPPEPSPSRNVSTITRPLSPTVCANVSAKVEEHGNKGDTVIWVKMPRASARRTRVRRRSGEAEECVKR